MRGLLPGQTGRQVGYGCKGLSRHILARSGLRYSTFPCIRLASGHLAPTQTLIALTWIATHPEARLDTSARCWALSRLV